jgi:hypothetical protein
VDKQLDTNHPGPLCEPVLRRSVCPSRSCTERIKHLVHGDDQTTGTNKRRRQAPRMVPASACRTARLSPCPDPCCAPIRTEHPHRLRHRPPGNPPRQGGGGVVHNGTSARRRAKWDGPVHGRAESGTPRCGQPVRRPAMRTHSSASRSSPLDSSTQGERKLSFENKDTTARPEEPPSFGGVSKGARWRRSPLPRGEGQDEGMRRATKSPHFSP